MSASIGTAEHRFDDGSVHKIRVEISPRGSRGYPAVVRDSGDHDIGIGGARQARVLANWLTLLADRLEERGQL